MPGVFDGLVFFVQTLERSKGRAKSDIDIIHDHGGRVVRDPSTLSVTHVIVHSSTFGRDHCHPLEQLSNNNPVLETPEDRHHWSFERILQVFTQSNKAYPSTGAKVLQSRWLDNCVKAGRLLGREEDWGGWLVRTKLIFPAPPQSPAAPAAVQASSPKLVPAPLSRTDPLYDPRTELSAPKQPAPMYSSAPSSSSLARQPSSTSSSSKLPRSSTDHREPELPGKAGRLYLDRDGNADDDRFDVANYYGGEGSTLYPHDKRRYFRPINSGAPQETESATPHASASTSQLGPQNELPAASTGSSSGIPEAHAMTPTTVKPRAIGELVQGEAPKPSSPVASWADQPAMSSPAGPGAAPASGRVASSSQHTNPLPPSLHASPGATAQRKGKQRETTSIKVKEEPMDYIDLRSSPEPDIGDEDFIMLPQTSAPVTKAPRGPQVPFQTPTSSNNTQIGSLNPQGIFAAGRKYPLTFHVADNNLVYQKLIEEEGGGVLAPLGEADCIILPLKAGEAPVEPQHCAIAQRHGINPFARVLSRDWVFQSVANENKVLDTEPYQIHPAKLATGTKRPRKPTGRTEGRPPTTQSQVGLQRRVGREMPLGGRNSQVFPYNGHHINDGSDEDFINEDENDEENDTSAPEPPKYAEHVEGLIALFESWDREGRLYPFLLSNRLPNSPVANKIIYLANKELIQTRLPWLRDYNHGRGPIRKKKKQ